LEWLHYVHHMLTAIGKIHRDAKKTHPHRRRITDCDPHWSDTQDVAPDLLCAKTFYPNTRKDFP